MIEYFFANHSRTFLWTNTNVVYTLYNSPKKPVNNKHIKL